MRKFTSGKMQSTNFLSVCLGIELWSLSTLPFVLQGAHTRSWSKFSPCRWDRTLWLAIALYRSLYRHTPMEPYGLNSLGEKEQAKNIPGQRPSNMFYFEWHDMFQLIRKNPAKPWWNMCVYILWVMIYKIKQIEIRQAQSLCSSMNIVFSCFYFFIYK